MEDSTGRYTYSHDALNRSKTVTTPAGKTITYSFDAVGNRKSMLDPDGRRFTEEMGSERRPEEMRKTWGQSAVCH